MTCAVCGQENPPEARFCLACGTPLEAAAASVGPAEERRVITAVFTDVIGLDGERRAARSRRRPRPACRPTSRVSAVSSRASAARSRSSSAMPSSQSSALLELTRTTANEPCGRPSPSAGRSTTSIEDDPWLDLHVRIGVATGESLVAQRGPIEPGRASPLAT